MNRGTLLVVGHGMAGHRLVEEVRARDRAGRWRIVAVTDEPHPAYDRVALSTYLAGRTIDELSLVRAELRNDPLVAARTGTAVTAIDPGARTAHCADGATIHWDALVLATGSRPFVPPMPGHDLPGCFVYRTVADLDAIRAAAVPGRPGVVVGGGLLGLEAADALRRLGMSAHVVELAPYLMPMQLDADGGTLLKGLIAALGVRPHCGARTVSVDAGPDGRVAGVTLAGDPPARLAAELVIFAAGVRPRDDLASAAGLPRAERGGILVDGHCRTGVPGIWAIGECAAPDGRAYGLLAPGYRMAETVAAQLTGPPGEPLREIDTSTTLKVLGVDVASFGDAHATTPGALRLGHTDHARSRYASLVLDANAETLLGGTLVGDTANYAPLAALTGRPLPTEPERLLADGALTR
ncbi:NAD(P)/FAD-dependent oxidoreductase [Streptomyces litchfieldiae]|uniref:FAD-dependent oxidoreductase n=1 Tax=Streptomyces litchfieldiae TaxID=3075543 RepID=A0ABU2MVY7_9ACTN|nr:FAD-dependent oxidoreductase [Streptomyces sp. DSM 44938]MDT0345798.1 FAD-dependent oxidoreductase [Streptomyces sp. DSM 44938]